MHHFQALDRQADLIEQLQPNVRRLARTRGHRVGRRGHAKGQVIRSIQSHPADRADAGAPVDLLALASHLTRPERGPLRIKIFDRLRKRPHPRTRLIHVPQIRHRTNRLGRIDDRLPSSLLNIFRRTHRAERKVAYFRQFNLLEPHFHRRPMPPNNGDCTRAPLLPRSLPHHFAGIARMT